MEKLSIFEQKILTVLSKLQYLCDIVASYEHNTKEGITYTFGDMFPPVKDPEELEYVVQYLKKHGLDISITFDIGNDNPSESIYIKKYGEIDNVPLGLIKGKNIEIIKTNIRELICELSPTVTEEKKGPPEMYSNNKEVINLKTLNVKIRGNCISVKKLASNKKVFDRTEEALIYFLYFRFKKNKDEYFSIETLAKELKTSEGHLKNRMTNIHKIIKKTMSENALIRDNLIKNTFGRGYRLNPRLFV